MSTISPRIIGAPINRIDGPAKVTGSATYAFEHQVDHPVYLYPLQATIVHGWITSIDTSAVSSMPGVLDVLTYENAPKLVTTTERPELLILQSNAVAHRNQLIGAVIAETPEIARYAASLIRFDYEEQPHDVDFHAARADLRPPQQVPVRTEYQAKQEDIDAALAAAAVTVDATYTTPRHYHSPMEPHSNIAIWADNKLTLYCSTQGVHWARQRITHLFGLDMQQVRVISPHVGGGFGSKLFPLPDMVLAIMAAQLLEGRPVKFALTRQQMFSLAGYRSPTIQHVRLGASPDGRLTALYHDAIVQCGKIMEFAENCIRATPVMYATPLWRTTQLVADLDVPAASMMRGPGEAPGMFALESAIDEMAIACGLDPIEFRIRNELEAELSSRLPFSSRHLITCLREGARLFGWETHDPVPRNRRVQGWLIGTGVASSVYHMLRFPGNVAKIHASTDGHYTVSIGASDIGTGTWTTLTQIAADTLEVSFEDVTLQIGDTDLPVASLAGASAGMNTWGTAVVEAARKFRELLLSDYGGRIPDGGLEVTAEMPANPYLQQVAMFSFGAQFAEVWVHEDTGEIRVPRLLGMFDIGRIINAQTVRSQLLGGMTMGLSMALHENGVFDPQFGHTVTQDLATYHIASSADVGSIEAHWVGEEDLYFNPMGSKGAGEIGIVGTAAAIANAAYNATGIRVRDLPLTLDKFLR
jgi:xanthine dehydrogenase YagR molybdenum-binding subunit